MMIEEIRKQYKGKWGQHAGSGKFVHSKEYVNWLENKLALALSRIEAAEELQRRCRQCNTIHHCPKCDYYLKHQAAIRAMEGK